MQPPAVPPDSKYFIFNKNTGWNFLVGRSLPEFNSESVYAPIENIFTNYNNLFEFMCIHCYNKWLDIALSNETLMQENHKQKQWYKEQIAANKKSAEDWLKYLKHYKGTSLQG